MLPRRRLNVLIHFQFEERNTGKTGSLRLCKRVGKASEKKNEKNEKKNREEKERKKGETKMQR